MTVRVRPLRNTRRRSPVVRRDLQVRPAAPPAPAPAAPAPAATRDLGPERRMREAGGPEDTARFHCGCGFVWHDAVTTSVACPHCGSGQAW